jgi:DNA-binding transcriptional ArsR family regulator
MNEVLENNPEPCVPQTYDEVAARFAALSHPARIEILQYLSGNRFCCCKEVVEQFDLAQSTVSQHLKILVEAGLVKFSSEKQRSRYELDRAALSELSISVARLVQSCGGPHEK